MGWTGWLLASNEPELPVLYILYEQQLISNMSLPKLQSYSGISWIILWGVLGCSLEVLFLSYWKYLPHFTTLPAHLGGSPHEQSSLPSSWNVWPACTLCWGWIACRTAVCSKANQQRTGNQPRLRILRCPSFWEGFDSPHWAQRHHNQCPIAPIFYFGCGELVVSPSKIN